MPWKDTLFISLTITFLSPLILVVLLYIVEEMEKQDNWYCINNSEEKGRVDERSVSDGSLERKQ